MAYLTLENFLGGVDRSRPRYALPPGSIWSGINGHITRGGDFEKRKAFVSKYSLPVGTFSLAKTPADGLVTFGSIPNPGVPAGITYQRLQHPTSLTAAITSIVSHDLYNGLLYVVADFDDTTRHHYYNGVCVSDWETQASPFPSGGFGSLVRTHKRKIYSPVGSVLWFSGLDTPTGWEYTGGSADSGAGFQNLSTHQGGSDTIISAITYQSYLALFSRRVIQIWDMQDNEDNNAPVQTIYESGSRAARALIGFGDVDAFYLADDGIRSIRSRSLSNVAGVNDVGTPVDTLVVDWMSGLSESEISQAVSVIEPSDGRFMMAIGSRIFVFSYFPTKKVSAWTWYEPGITFSDLVSHEGRVYGRSGDTVYLYGGDDNATYDDSVATLELPFLTTGKIGNQKHWTGFDCSASGEWSVQIRVNPNDENQVVEVGDIDGVTVPDESIKAEFESHYAAVSMSTTGSEAASVSQILLYYNDAKQKS